MQPIDLPSRFFSPRRSRIRYIVLHTTEGTDSRTWLTQTGNVSAHYLIQAPRVYRLVDEGDAAWHAGIIVGEPTTPYYTGEWEDIYENGVLLGGGWTVSPNDESIGIEIEGYAASSLSPLTIETTVELIRDIRFRRGPLPLVAHSHLSPGNRSDPGVENFARIIAALEEDMDIAELERRIDAKIAAYAQEARATGFEPLKAGLAMVDDRVDALEKRLDSVNATGEHEHDLPVTRTSGPVAR